MVGRQLRNESTDVKLTIEPDDTAVQHPLPAVNGSDDRVLRSDNLSEVSAAAAYRTLLDEMLIFEWHLSYIGQPLYKQHLHGITSIPS